MQRAGDLLSGGADRPLGLRSGEIGEGRVVGPCPCRRGAGMQPPSATPPGTRPPYSSKHPLPRNWEPALSGQMRRNPSQRYRCWSSFIHEPEQLSKDFQKLKEKWELEREQETWFSFKWQWFNDQGPHFCSFALFFLAFLYHLLLQ